MTSDGYGIVGVILMLIFVAAGNLFAAIVGRRVKSDARAPIAGVSVGMAFTIVGVIIANAVT